jgi:hypothetical protein
MPVASDPLIRQLAGDDSLTRELGDVEARMLVEWVVDWGELLAATARTSQEAERLLLRLRRRGRAINRFVHLWCQRPACAAAVQLAAVERFAWPLPDAELCQPIDLMDYILNWERQEPPALAS